MKKIIRLSLCLMFLAMSGVTAEAVPQVVATVNNFPNTASTVSSTVFLRWEATSDIPGTSFTLCRVTHERSSDQKRLSVSNLPYPGVRFKEYAVDPDPFGSQYAVACVLSDDNTNEELGVYVAERVYALILPERVDLKLFNTTYPQGTDAGSVKRLSPFSVLLSGNDGSSCGCTAFSASNGIELNVVGWSGNIANLTTLTTYIIDGLKSSVVFQVSCGTRTDTLKIKVF